LWCGLLHCALTLEPACEWLLADSGKMGEAQSYG